MALYRASVNARAGINATNSPLFQLRSSTTSRLRIVEYGVTVTTAPTNAPQFALARATAVGTSSTTVAGTPNDPGEPTPTGTLDSAWSVAPTFTTSGPFLWTQTVPVAAGNGFVWVAADVSQGIVVPTSAGVILAALNASGATVGAHAFYVVWDE